MQLFITCLSLTVIPCLGLGWDTFRNQGKEPDVKVVWRPNDYILQFKDRMGPYIKLKRGPAAAFGTPWPLPQQYDVNQSSIFRICKKDLTISSNRSCDIVSDAIKRYKDTIFKYAMEELRDNLRYMRSDVVIKETENLKRKLHNETDVISYIRIIIRKPCTTYPSETDDEFYKLWTERFGIFITANEVWGALRGLETLSQLVYKYRGQFYIRGVQITDYPRFRHRGILIDTARHYIQKQVILQVVDSMAQNKMNVLHWHIVDDQSFPYQSLALPNITEKGAYHPTLIYTHKDISEIIEYARLRGVRIMPEFDTPGHTYSWGYGDPELLTECFHRRHLLQGYKGPIDPTKEHTYEVLSKLFEEVFRVFVDKYIHLGGDEVPMECWNSNPKIKSFIYKLQQNSNNIGREALKYYVQRFINSLNKLSLNRTNGARYVMWEEILDQEMKIPKDTIIHVWKGNQNNIKRALDRNYQIIYSTCWYLDWIEYGTQWAKYYQCDPGSYVDNDSNILGGEACLWSEYITNENLISTMWPRACAVAERLWSDKSTRNMLSAGERLQEHRCRMVRRGFNVGHANGPGYCLRSQDTKEAQEQKFMYFPSFYFARAYMKETILRDLVFSSCLFSITGILLIVAIFSSKLRLVVLTRR